MNQNNTSSDFTREKKELVHSFVDDDGFLQEKTENVTEIVRIPKRHFRKGEFYMSSLAFDRLILEKGYKSVETRVLTALKLRLGFNNQIEYFTQKEIASQIKSSKANVCRALKKLSDDRIIYKDGHHYYFNSNLIKGAGNDKKRRSIGLYDE